MAAVHAVEVADGQRGAAPGAPQRAVRDHHGVVKILIIDEMSVSPMKTAEQQMASYAAYHQDARNKATHFIGVPVIVLSLFIPLAWLRFEIGGLA
ncbi:MAG TPA: Mpo1-like protein, partial [Burkholderiales bacterium]|nr:Mpo1-like protein [Burkholderiales bacterium]